MARIGKEFETTALSVYLSEVEKVPLLSQEEEYELAVRAKSGDLRARDRIVSANTRFVISVAKKFQGRGLSLEDLISEGNIGLLIAVDKFEPEKGYHFISYAIWWIRQSILKALADKSRMIRLPMNKAADYVQVQSVKYRLEQDGEQTSLENIAGECDMTASQVAEILSYARDVMSLNTPVSEGEGTAFGDFIESDDAGPEDIVIEESLSESVDRLLGELSEKERDVIVRRFGLHDVEQMSLQEIGEIYGLTKERIRQIEKKVLDGFRGDSRVQDMKCYIA
ncbi:MAG: RNA polymerase sigma factor RpoD/SigA [Sphaerochaetaceae bacterium]|nr:RNA polymerase sigma factor RpoD/SigA [Sphaerochaetaceae bacterium]